MNSQSNLLVFWAWDEYFFRQGENEKWDKYMPTGAEDDRLKTRSLQCKVLLCASLRFPASPAEEEARLMKCRISMENWVGETRRNRIILIQYDIIKCRNQRLLAAQNLLEPWSGYLHFILTCCSLFTKPKLFQKGWKGDRDFGKSLGKRQNKQKPSVKQHYSKRLFLKNTQ